MPTCKYTNFIRFRKLYLLCKETTRLCQHIAHRSVSLGEKRDKRIYYIAKKSMAITTNINMNITIINLKLKSIPLVSSLAIVISASNALFCLNCPLEILSNNDLICFCSVISNNIVQFDLMFFYFPARFHRLR